MRIQHCIIVTPETRDDIIECDKYGILNLPYYPPPAGINYDIFKSNYIIDSKDIDKYKDFLVENLEKTK